MATPFVYIEPPDVEDRPYGIFGNARPLPVSDEHWTYGGVEFEALACYGAGFYPMGPGTQGGAGGSKTLPNGKPTSKGAPFAVYGGISCGSVGYTDEQAKARAVRVVELSAQHAVEQALWTGAGANSPKLNDSTTTIVNGTATKMETALGLLEDWLGDNYNARGFIHMKRRAGIIGGGKRIIVRDRDVTVPALQTVAGSRVILGAGYDGTGPNAVAPATGQQWIYATGQVGILRGPISTPANLGEAINKTNNVVTLIAEQPYLVTFDCAVAAVLVDLTV